MTDTAFVAHFKAGTSDKIYLCYIKRDGRNFIVMSKWGKRNADSLMSQIKGTYATLPEAKIQMRKYAEEKMKKGYTDIESGSYAGDFTLDEAEKKHMERLDGVENLTPKKESAKEKYFDPKEELILCCLNNKGFEERFDIKVTYIGHWASKNDGEFVVVGDKFNVAQTMEAARFKIVKEE